MAVTSFDVDKRTAATIERLRSAFGVKTNAGVIRKALALANIASQHADADGTITIAPSEDGKPAVNPSLAESRSYFATNLANKLISHGFGAGFSL